MVSKPEKPRPDFPLFAHNNGQWAKKILQKMWYFGPWEDPAAAEAAYNSQAKDLHAGKKPRPTAEQCTLEFLCDAFMTYNDEQLQAGQMKEVTHKDYRDMCVDILKLFGKARLASDLDQEDFRKFANDMVKRGLGPATRGTAIARVKRLFNFGVEDGILSEKPVYGSGFKRPTKQTMDILKASKPQKLFEREEIIKILAAATPALKAMTLLGVNCGFGNNDVGRLCKRHLDLQNGWVTYARQKNGTPRRCWLWPETVDAVKESLAIRPKAKDPKDNDLVFTTNTGRPWIRGSECPITKEFAKLLTRIGIKKEGICFYTLRHVTKTIGKKPRTRLPWIGSWAIGYQA